MVKELLAKKLLVVEKLEDDSIKNIRLTICKACPKNNNGECTVCTCILEIKTGCLTNRNPKKFGRIEVTHCPLGKWGDEETARHYNKNFENLKQKK